MTFVHHKNLNRLDTEGINFTTERPQMTNPQLTSFSVRESGKLFPADSPANHIPGGCCAGSSGCGGPAPYPAPGRPGKASLAGEGPGCVCDMGSNSKEGTTLKCQTFMGFQERMLIFFILSIYSFFIVFFHYRLFSLYPLPPPPTPRPSREGV